MLFFFSFFFFLSKLQSNLKKTLLCLNIVTPKTVNFPFVPNGKLMVLGVPIL